jgi:polar amino acid transport system permease protein
MTQVAPTATFAPEQGPPSAAARAAVWIGIASVTFALVRPVLDAGGADTAVRWPARASMLLAAAAFVSAMSGLYDVAARGRRGRWLVAAALAIAAAGALLAYLYAAVHDGSLRPGRFFHLYFEGKVIRAVAGDLLRGAVNTIKLAFVSEAIAVLIGLVLATFRLSHRWWLRLPAVGYVDLVRGLPLVVLASLVNYGLPFIGITLGLFAAATATLVINASAYVAEIFRAGIQALPTGQMEAARSLGMPYGTAMLFVVIPQAVRAVIPPLMSEFIALVKDTAIVLVIIGFTVATRDIYGAAQNGASSTFSPTPFMAAAIVYLIITVPLTRLVGRLEKRLRVGLA